MYYRNAKKKKGGGEGREAIRKQNIDCIWRILAFVFHNQLETLDVPLLTPCIEHLVAYVQLHWIVFQDPYLSLLTVYGACALKPDQIELHSQSEASGI